MTMILTGTKTALSPGLTASFLATNGTSPYTYAVLPTNSAGGSIDSSSGLYQAPVSAPTQAQLQYDTIQATDSLGNTATAQILVGGPLILFCEIIQRGLNLPAGRVYLWDQKIFQPTNTGIYVVVSVVSCKPIGNVIEPAIIASNPNWSESFQYATFQSTLDVNIISRDMSAVLQKEQVLMALNSSYSEQQQEGNSFLIGKMPPNVRFTNLSGIDGAAIPYRFVISINIQYAVTLQENIDYFSTFQIPAVYTNP